MDEQGELFEGQEYERRPSSEREYMGAEQPGKWQRVGQSTTSRVTAQQVTPLTGPKRIAVYEYVVGCGRRGATDEEIQNGIPMSPSTQRPRRVELVERGWLFDSGRERRTATGHKAVVWVSRAWSE